MPDIRIQHADVAKAFDAVAPAFESTLENQVTARIREIVYGTIRPLLPRRSSILDINCGIGLDAMALAAEGHVVTGIDVSAGMIAEAKKRSAIRPNLNVRFLISSFDDLSPLGGETFNLILSNFGGLNCVESLGGIFHQVARVTNPNGYFLGVVMPKLCPWEVAAGLVRLQPRLAFRRFQHGVTATGFRNSSFTVYYHSLSTLISSAATWFDPVAMRGLSLMSPPPHARSFRNQFQRVSRLLDVLDDHVGGLPFLRGMGDHYLVLLRRNLTPVEPAYSNHV